MFFTLFKLIDKFKFIYRIRGKKVTLLGKKAKVWLLWKSQSNPISVEGVEEIR